MSDPAIEAAQRAWIKEGWGDVLQLSEGHLAVAVAREALKPIRELHRPTGWGGECVVCFGSEGYGAPWPCETAKLVYTTEELGAGAQ